MIAFLVANMAPIMFAALVVFLLLGYPVAFALAFNGLFFGIIGIKLGLFNQTLFQALPERIYGNVLGNETLLAIPFFTFMGLILERSGMAEELLDTIGQVFGPVRGGLAYAVIFVGALLAATTGVVAASVIAMGLISLPIMLRYGYDRRLAAGVIAASGTLAQIIPPSLVLIVMADQLGRPVGDMYKGAIVPGFILAGLYAVYVMAMSLLVPSSAPGLPAREQTLREPSENRDPLILPAALLLAAATTMWLLLDLRVADLTANLIPTPLNDYTWLFGLYLVLALFFIALARGLTLSLVLLTAATTVLAVLFSERLSGHVEPGSEPILGAAGAFLITYVLALANKFFGFRLVSRLAQDVVLVLMPPLVLIFLVLGTIFIGLATPTEGGAMGAVGALALAFLKGRLGLGVVRQALDSTVKLSAFVLFILIGSRVFSLTFFGVNGHVWVENLLTSLPGGVVGFLIVVNLIVFVLAFFLDFFELAFIVVPLLGPAAEHLGIDLIWFGVLLGINMQTAFMHPPFGFSLFYLRSVAPRDPYLDRVTGRRTEPVTTGQIYWGAVPFVGIQILMIGLTILFPSMVTHYQTKSAIAPANVRIEIPAAGNRQAPNFAVPAAPNFKAPSGPNFGSPPASAK
jgi:TRAP-type mannitol/chloroaromatic compound transport system permease large subunit